MAASSRRADRNWPTTWRRRATTGSARRWLQVMPPKFVDDRRAAALEVYERESVPTWRRSGFWTTTLRHLRLDELETKRYDAVTQRPEIVANDELAALIVQKGASIVYSEVNDERITLTSLEEAAESHPELVEKYWQTSGKPDEG